MKTGGRFLSLVRNFASKKRKTYLFAAVAALALPALLTAQGGKNTSPTDVRDVDNPTRQPWQNDQAILANAPNQGTTELACGPNFRVPDGKRLVIEFVSGYGILPTGQRWLRLQLESMLAGSNAGQALLHQVGLQFAGTNSLLAKYDIGITDPVDYYSVSQQTRIYSDPGTFVRACAVRNGDTGIAILRVSLSGYLVNVP